MIVGLVPGCGGGGGSGGGYGSSSSSMVYVWCVRVVCVVCMDVCGVCVCARACNADLLCMQSSFLVIYSACSNTAFSGWGAVGGGRWAVGGRYGSSAISVRFGRIRIE